MPLAAHHPDAPEPTRRIDPKRSIPRNEATEPCLRCGTLLPARVMGCKGGRCPNCGHVYPHGDCSD